MIKKHTQNNVDEPGPQLVVEPPPQGQFPLSVVVYDDCFHAVKYTAISFGEQFPADHLSPTHKHRHRYLFLRSTNNKHSS